MPDKLLGRSRVFKIYQKIVKFKNGKTGVFEYISLYEDTLDSVLVLPLTKNNEIIFIQEYCQALDKSELFLPGGVVDAGESPEKAAVREMGEETGFIANKVEKVGTIELLPKYIYSQTHFFIARELERSNQFSAGDEIEDITIQKIPLTNTYNLIKDGSLRDVRSVSLCLMALRLFDCD